MEAEVDSYLAAFADERDERADRLVTRNGRAEPRTLTTAGGPAALPAFGTRFPIVVVDRGGYSSGRVRVGRSFSTQSATVRKDSPRLRARSRSRSSAASLASDSLNISTPVADR